MARAYDSSVDGKILKFEYLGANHDMFKDKQTGSEWNFDGKGINGQLKGKQLIRLPFDEGFWFEWAAFHPKTELYTRSLA
jgi:hypothetical protein